MKTTNLGEITKIKTGKLDANAKVEGGKYPFFTCSKEISWIGVPSYDCECVLIAGNGDLNVKYYKGKFDAYQRTYIIESNRTKDLDMKYLYYFMDQYMETLRGQTIGGVIQYIRMNNLTNIQIPLPPLATQRAIADKLDKLKSLIDLKKQAITKTDELAKSIFLEMFGDPMKNEKSWEMKKLSEVISIKHGFAFKSEFFANSGKYVLLTPGNFYEEGGYKDRGEKQKYYIGTFPNEYLLKKGNLLVAMTEQAPGLLGSPIIIPKSDVFLHNQRLGLLKFDNKNVNTEFMFHLFNFPGVRNIIQSTATGTKVQHTSPTKIESIILGIPPLPLQQKFADIISQIEVQKSNHKVALAKLEELYQTTMQESFRV